MQNAGSFGVLGVISVHDKRDLLAEFFAAGEVEALQNLAPVGLKRVAKMHLALKRRRVLIAPDVVFRPVRFLIQKCVKNRRTAAREYKLIHIPHRKRRYGSQQPCFFHISSPEVRRQRSKAARKR